MARSAKLNVDVVAIVCEFFNDLSDVLSFSLTCSTFHRVAIRRLLSMRPVDLKGGTSTRKFYDFLLAEAHTHRAPLIRALNIDIKIGSPETHQAAQQNDASILLDILSACAQIQFLSIPVQPARYSITDYPHVVAAIGALRNLRSLSVHVWLARQLALFHAVNAPVRKISRHSMLSSDPEVRGRWSSSILEEFLPRFAPTLEKLELNKFITDEDSAPSVFDMTQYPAVRSLSVGSISGTPRLDHLQRLFPALAGTLSLGRLDLKFSFLPSEDTRFEILTNMRAENEQAQERLGSRAWKKVDRVICDARMFYVLRLRYPIRLVMLDSCLASGGDSRYARYALRENPAPRLKLSMVLDSSTLTGLGEIFSPELTGMLTHLTLCLVYANDFLCTTAAQAEAFATIRWNDLLESMASKLRPLHQLTHLRIIIRSQVYQDETEEALAYAQHSEEFVRALRRSAFDFEGTAASLLGSPPSLRYLFLTTSSNLADTDRDWRTTFERWHETRAWRIAGSGTNEANHVEPLLVSLHDQVVKTIIRKEELVLSDTDTSSAYCNVAGKILFQDED
ncbi:hypothetical protein GSI_07763 [Ganoderma sinense ZZ0214-1]|uniref:Uncharacterized protein n=1 Tax=Ganoderma sinense ZZ0214-1 TaxID=1077348 RepID=A0A2G8S8V1_9APHY|nr:hypothetical protein GSI_07763 [Ganoderma sinense ZZ0214-1]